MNTNPSPIPARPARLAALAALILLALAPAPTARAAGLLIADGGLGGVLEIKEQAVSVSINNGVAVTEVTQIFHNTENRQVEALYTFPVPKEASVSNFSMWIGGKEMIGEVLEKKKAREIYNSYKAKRQDPGLLEQVDYKTFEMRVYPINPQADQKVQITYYQELDFDDDTATYVYPLATVTRKGIDSRTKGRFALTLAVKSEIPIAELASPSHKTDFVISKRAEDSAQASLEVTAGDLDRDVVLTCRTARPHTGIDLIASRQNGKEDGTFCLTLTAGQELAALAKGMDYIFVMDISGSMGAQGKLDVSRGSVGAFIKSLSPDDNFEVMTFNVEPTLLFKALTKGEEPAKAKALEFIGAQIARGGTVLRPALETAYKYATGGKPLNVVILSDGMSETGERAELLRLIAAKPAGVKVFCVGVGNDVNRPLLTQMAEDAGGLAAFISQGDDFERQAKAFRRKLTHPVASEIKLEFAGGDVYDLEPAKLPNLYHGMPVRMFGRYKKAGPVKVTLRATVMDKPIETTAELKFPEGDDTNPEIERMWAWHRVQRLLNEGDRAGSRDPAIAEVVRLGEAYSIATEYTSFLVLENDAEYQRWRIERRNVLRVERDRRKQAALRADLEKLNEKTLAALGPVPASAASSAPAKGGLPEVLYEGTPDNVARPTPAPAQARPVQPVSAPAQRPINIPTRPSRGADISIPVRHSGGGGGGALDPVTGAIALGLAALALRRRK